MGLPLTPPAPLKNISPELRRSLQERVERNLITLVTRLSASRFYHESAPLHHLRDALGTPGIGASLDAEGKDILAVYYDSVPLTTYSDYAPYVARLIPVPDAHAISRVADVRHLLAPGLPAYVAYSSGTTGSAAKYFLKYPSTVYKPARWDTPEAASRHSKLTCNLACIRLSKVVRLLDDADLGEKEHDDVCIPVAQVSAGGLRTYLGIGPTEDAHLANHQAPFCATPFAAWLLPAYNSTVYMNAFFGLINARVERVATTFSTILCDAVRLIETNWAEWIISIELGNLPDIEGLGEYRENLQAFLKPNPERADELRQITPGSEGFLKKVWPKLDMVTVTLSGPYAMALPKLRHVFGATVSFQSAVYAATESMVGFGYDVNDHNLFRLDSSEHIELLDIDQECSTENLCQPWEVVAGKNYEVIITNSDGLWRYRLNDVVEVAGFSPMDGQPLIHYVGRKDVAFRIHSEFVSQSFLQQAINSLSGALGSISEFIVEPDDRKPLRAYGFIVELQGELGPNASQALEQLKEYMCLNEGYKKCFDINCIGNPTIRIVSAGTFNAYRVRQVENTTLTPAQVKIPCAITDPIARKWFADRVVKDLDIEYGSK